MRKLIALILMFAMMSCATSGKWETVDRKREIAGKKKANSYSKDKRDYLLFFTPLYIKSF